MKFVLEGPKRNANICAREKVDPMMLWKLGEGKYRIDELLMMLKELKQIQKDEEKENVCRSH